MSQKDQPASAFDPAEEASAFVAARFRLADPGHPATAWLKRAAAERLQEALVLDPGALESLRPALPEAREFPDAACPDFSPAKRQIKEINPPPLPQVFAALQGIANDPLSSLADMAQIISHDPGLSSFLLRLANSAFYSFPGGVDSVFRAAQLIGMREILSLAAAKAVSGLFNESPRKDLLEVERFWRHSVACAILARALAKRAGRTEPDRAFMAGLLHDVGKILLVIAEPDMCEASLLLARQSGLILYEAERRTLGFDHAELGASVLKRWVLPQPLIEAVQHHHAPSRDVNAAGSDAVHVADVIALSLGIGPRPDCLAPPMDAGAWESLGLAPEDLGPVIGECDSRLDELRELFLGPKARRGA